MKLSVRASAIAGAVVFGLLVMFATGITNIVFPGYGQALLDTMATLYPGYHARPRIDDVIVGTLYGALDGAALGALFSVTYNLIVRTKRDRSA